MRGSHTKGKVNTVTGTQGPAPPSLFLSHGADPVIWKLGKGLAVLPPGQHGRMSSEKNPTLRPQRAGEEEAWLSFWQNPWEEGL